MVPLLWDCLGFVLNSAWLVLVRFGLGHFREALPTAGTESTPHMMRCESQDRGPEGRSWAATLRPLVVLTQSVLWYRCAH